jgi:hypothetical protein
MTESVTPRAPDPPLVDPETGETAPLSPRERCCAEPLLMSLDSLPPYVYCTRCRTRVDEDGFPFEAGGNDAA